MTPFNCVVVEKLQYKHYETHRWECYIHTNRKACLKKDAYIIAEQTGDGKNFQLLQPAENRNIK